MWFSVWSFSILTRSEGRESSGLEWLSIQTAAVAEIAKRKKQIFFTALMEKESGGEGDEILPLEGRRGEFLFARGV